MTARIISRTDKNIYSSLKGSVHAKFRIMFWNFPRQTLLVSGWPLCGMLSDIFMDHFEDKIFQSNNPTINNVLYLWLRNGPMRLLRHFLVFTNSFFSSVKFTLGVIDQRINTWISPSPSMMVHTFQNIQKTNLLQYHHL